MRRVQHLDGVVAVLGTASIAAVISAVIALGSGAYWERRKLIRAERVRAYSEYLAADSERWRAFGFARGARRRGDVEAEASADESVARAREDMYRAYTLAQVAGSQEVVSAMLACIRVSDARQRAYAGRAKSPASDARAAALATLVKAARADVHLSPLPPETFARSGDTDAG